MLCLFASCLCYAFRMLLHAPTPHHSLCLTHVAAADLLPVLAVSFPVEVCCYRLAFQTLTVVFPSESLENKLSSIKYFSYFSKVLMLCPVTSNFVVSPVFVKALWVSEVSMQEQEHGVKKAEADSGQGVWDVCH